MRFTGYLSLVVNKIASMMLKYNAPLIMEDLNFGFKRGRFKVEKQVYQKFEKMLIDKLNYFAFKPNVKNIQDNGGILKGYQLSSKFDSFQKLGKQTGFIFYVPAWNTSHIDPTTGFCNLFILKWKNIATTKEFFNTFKGFSYNEEKSCYEFNFTYSDFDGKFVRNKDFVDTWTVYTLGDRLVWNNNERKTVLFDATKEIDNLLNKYSIDFISGNLLEKIMDIKEASFWKSLLYCFKQIMSLRNSNPNSVLPEDDYILSPVINKWGKQYDSREFIEGLPKDSDANGAYNIALKGLQLFKNQLIYAEKNNEYKIKPSKNGCQNNEWLNFIQKLKS